MKVSYSNYPILEKLKNGSLGNMNIFEHDQYFFNTLGQAFVNNWKFYAHHFRKEINYISQTFSESSDKAADKLLDLYGDIVINDTSDMHISSTILIGDFVCMLYYDIKKGSNNNELCFFMFDKKGIPLAYLVDSTERKIYQQGWISNSFEVPNNNTDVFNWLSAKVANMIILKMFKSYADVETKFLKSNSKLKDIDCKYVNDTTFDITYLDCKWFTNLVKSDGFSVRGHFRLQPKKHNGKWTKELIWINDFKKSGYSSKARMLTTSPLEQTPPA
jgi:hypothetical protein